MCYWIIHRTFSVNIMWLSFLVVSSLFLCCFYKILLVTKFFLCSCIFYLLPSPSKQNTSQFVQTCFSFFGLMNKYPPGRAACSQQWQVLLGFHPICHEEETTASYPTAPDTILEPQDLGIGKICVAQERHAVDFEAPKSWKGRSGKYRYQSSGVTSWSVTTEKKRRGVLLTLYISTFLFI